MHRQGFSIPSPIPAVINRLNRQACAAFLNFRHYAHRIPQSSKAGFVHSYPGFHHCGEFDVIQIRTQESVPYCWVTERSSLFASIPETVIARSEATRQSRQEQDN